jgi:hypothetical protein
LAIDVFAPSDERWHRRARTIWIIGAAALLLHATAAFHFRHHWSHAAAWEHTREQTLALTGWNSGQGLYANYAMTVWWLVDAICWLGWSDWPRRHRGWYWATMLVFGFLLFNATVVFGPPYWKYLVGAFAVGVVGAKLMSRRE